MEDLALTKTLRGIEANLDREKTMKAKQQSFMSQFAEQTRQKYKNHTGMVLDSDFYPTLHAANGM